MSKGKTKEVVAEVETSAAAPSEMEVDQAESNLKTESANEKPKFSQSTKEVEVEVIKDFKGLKAGQKLTVSKNVAEILTHKGLVK